MSISPKTKATKERIYSALPTAHAHLSIEQTRGLVLNPSHTDETHGPHSVPLYVCKEFSEKRRNRYGNDGDQYTK
jgi:hypothetical protein